jgi:hypothetical protein
VRHPEQTAASLTLVIDLLFLALARPRARAAIA